LEYKKQEALKPRLTGLREGGMKGRDNDQRKDHTKTKDGGPREKEKFWEKGETGKKGDKLKK